MKTEQDRNWQQSCPLKFSELLFILLYLVGYSFGPQTLICLPS